LGVRLHVALNPEETPPFAIGTRGLRRPPRRAPIEINRGLYIDERTLERTNGYVRVRADMTRLAEALSAAALHMSLAWIPSAGAYWDCAVPMC
jgi:hypothetical protein